MVKVHFYLHEYGFVFRHVMKQGLIQLECFAVNFHKMDASAAGSCSNLYFSSERNTWSTIDSLTICSKSSHEATPSPKTLSSINNLYQVL